MLQFCCNIIFYFKYFPLALRIATIFCLFKGGDLCDWDPGSWRGISSVHQFASFLENLIFRRMRSICNSSISNYQAGGRAKCGATQQLLRLFEHIQCLTNASKPTRKGEGFANHVVLALLDASKAFDRIFRPLLFAKLREMGITGRLFSVLVSYFAGRYQRVNVEDAYSEFVETIHGGPQGSVIVLFC